MMNYINDLSSLSTNELAEIWNSLNTWNWHTALGEEPDNWHSLPDYSKKNVGLTKKDIITPVVKYIKSKIGEKECLRWHHQNNLNRTDVEFESWWTKEEAEQSSEEIAILNETYSPIATKYEIERLLTEIISYHREVFINKCLDEREYDLLRKYITDRTN